MPEKPSIKEFIKAFGDQWLTKMSGPLTVPFTLLAFFVPQTWLKLLFAALAILCAAVSAYIIWAKERIKFLEEEAKNGEPEIKIRLIKALHHVIALDNTMYVGPSFVTLHVGLVNVRHVPTTIKGYALKIFLERSEFTGAIVPSNVRFSIAKEKVLEHKGLDKPIQVVKEPDVEAIIPLDQTISHSNPLTYMLEQQGYLHFTTGLPLFKYEMEENPKVPAAFTIVLTLTDPRDGIHMERFEKIAIEPANLRIVGTQAEKELRQPPKDIWRNEQ